MARLLKQSQRKNRRLKHKPYRRFPLAPNSRLTPLRAPQKCFCADRQSDQNVSRETLLSDWRVKPDKTDVSRIIHDLGGGEHAGAEPRQSLPQRFIRDWADEFLRRRLGGLIRHAGHRPGELPCRERSLFQLDTRDTAPAEVGVDALDDDGRRCCISSAKPLSTRMISVAVAAPSSAARSRPRAGHCILTGCEIAASRSPTIASQNKIRPDWPKPCRATTGSIAVWTKSASGRDQGVLRALPFRMRLPYRILAGRGNRRRVSVWAGAKQSRGASLQFLGRKILLAGRDPPAMPKRILEFAAAIAIELIRDRPQNLEARLHRSGREHIDIFDIKVDHHRGSADRLRAQGFVGRKFVAEQDSWPGRFRAPHVRSCPHARCKRPRPRRTHVCRMQSLHWHC